MIGTVWKSETISSIRLSGVVFNSLVRIYIKYNIDNRWNIIFSKKTIRWILINGRVHRGFFHFSRFCTLTEQSPICKNLLTFIFYPGFVIEGMFLLEEQSKRLNIISVVGKNQNKVTTKYFSFIFDILHQSFCLGLFFYCLSAFISLRKMQTGFDQFIS